MGRGIRNYDDVWEKLEELKLLREALCDLVGTDDNNVLFKWIEEQKTISHPCPGKYLLGLTKPKQEVTKKAWNDIVSNLERRNVSQSNITYIVGKLALLDSIEEAINSFEMIYSETKSFYRTKKRKSLTASNE